MCKGRRKNIMQLINFHVGQQQLTAYTHTHVTATVDGATGGGVKSGSVTVGVPEGAFNF
jgi:hypothetical protein